MVFSGIFGPDSSNQSNISSIGNSLVPTTVNGSDIHLIGDTIVHDTLHASNLQVYGLTNLVNTIQTSNLILNYTGPGDALRVEGTANFVSDVTAPNLVTKTQLSNLRQLGYPVNNISSASITLNTDNTTTITGPVTFMSNITILGTINGSSSLSSSSSSSSLSNTSPNFIFTSNVSIQGNLTINGDVTSLSDKTLKTNLEVIENPLEKIAKLTGYTYNRIDRPEGTPRECGLLAQDVISVLPEVVRKVSYHGKEHSEDIMTIAYGNMAGLFVEVIKEINNRLNKLEH